MMLICYIIAIAALLCWLVFLCRPDRFYQYTHIFVPIDQLASPSLPESTMEWPMVTVIIPARNEESVLPYTLPSVLNQEYPQLEVILINDQSTDQTQVVAQAIQQTTNGQRLRILQGQSLPAGWAGKLWAVQQGIQEAKGEWILLTDADLVYQNLHTLKSLMQHALQKKQDMVSLMARLQTQCFWEKLLIPAFLYFFKMLYPFKRVQEKNSKIAAAAGGCILIQRSTLDAIGGIAAIRDALIDDIALARAVKSQGFAIQLMDGPTLISYRGYANLSGLWKMVTRSAFTELKYSYLRLFGCTLGLLLLFFVPILCLFIPLISGICQWPIAVLGGFALILMSITYDPTIKYFELSRIFSLTLPLAGLLYLAMTLDSARQYIWGIRCKWKDREYAKQVKHEPKKS